MLGSGPLAAEKAAGLRAAGAEVSEEERFRPGMCRQRRLVIDATGDEATNQLVWEEAERLGVLVNVLDRPRQCRFIAPAVVDRDPLLIAISTSGESPFLAGAIRSRLERMIGPEWGPFVALVGQVRRGLRGKGVLLKDQTEVYRRLLRSSVRDGLGRGQIAEVEREVERLAGTAGKKLLGRVALVGAGPGDPTLLTEAAREFLLEADLVLYDTLVSEAVLTLCGPNSRLINVGKRRGRPGHCQRDIHTALIEGARAGQLVVRLKGGDPFVFGRGGEELAALVGAGIEVVVVPGVSSLLAAPAVAGVPLTMRGVSSSFAVATGQTTAGPPVDFGALASAADTLVVMMPLYTIETTVRSLLKVRPGGTGTVMVYDIGGPHQRVVRTTLAKIVGELGADAADGPAVLIVGDVVEAMPRLEDGDQL